MKLYIVTDGEYSSYHIEDVFLDKDIAETYCALHCPTGQIETYDTSDDNIKGKVNIYYGVRFSSYIDNGRITNPFDDRFTNPFHLELYRSTKPIYEKVMKCNQRYDINIPINKKDFNYKSAEKIARDFLVKYKAEKLNL